MEGGWPRSGSPPGRAARRRPVGRADGTKAALEAEAAAQQARRDWARREQYQAAVAGAGGRPRELAALEGEAGPLPDKEALREAQGELAYLKTLAASLKEAQNQREPARRAVERRISGRRTPSFPAWTRIRRGSGPVRTPSGSGRWSRSGHAYGGRRTVFAGRRGLRRRRGALPGELPVFCGRRAGGGRRGIPADRPGRAAGVGPGTEGHPRPLLRAVPRRHPGSGQCLPGQVGGRGGGPPASEAVDRSIRDLDAQRDGCGRSCWPLSTASPPRSPTPSASPPPCPVPCPWTSASPPPG